ncbi:mechanosensitive ion channel family protein [Yoonia sp. 2307UL14-13]|uniref:mechanosensitive ion channel family protein n=1 Tax=Yoonia sp. 2307UL14-13 TaxID=3126506 RepID=UPI0030A42C18
MAQEAPTDLLAPLTGAEQAPAEESTGEQTESAPAEEDPAPEVETPPFETLTDDSDWLRLARRAEEQVKADALSPFAATRLRAELVVWRDRFLEQTGVNGGRIATVDGQIAALGPVPENGEETEAVAMRRAELEAQKRALTAPQLLAQEAHARANGLISELDAQALQQQTRALADRVPSPLDLTSMAGGVSAVWNASGLLVAETVSGIRERLRAGQLFANLLRASLYLGLAGLLLIYLRPWLARRRSEKTHDTQSRFAPLWRLCLSFGQLMVSVLGLIALATGLETLGVFGLRGMAVIDTLPLAGMIIVGTWWLARHVFPPGDDAGYLRYDAATRRRGRRYGIGMAWIIGISTLSVAALQTTDVSDATAAALAWPILLILGILLWRFGRVIQQPPIETEDEGGSGGRTRGLLGRLCTLVAVVAPMLAAFGYMAAGQTLLVSSILSLALIGFVLVLQRVANDLTAPSRADEEQKGLNALLPIVISFLLFLASLPLFALIWGARVADLLELWQRFREGFAIGETRLSPTDFLTFAFVFAIGYGLTRFIQGTLRKTVLPRTRLDIGGQNAIVAGFGYVGIILAAIIAITSAGIDLSNLAIVAGALSVGIGFGLQNIVSNFVSGIILLIERPVSEGDWIEVGDQMGYVRSISVRSTRIETFDRTDVIVPNADLVSGTVTNWTRGNLIGRVIVPVGVAYGTDVEKVRDVLMQVAEEHPMVIATPPPVVLFRGFGADSLDFEIRAILRDVNYVMPTHSEMNFAIAQKFAEEGIEIPFAQRDIWLRNPEVLKDDKA